MADNIGLRQNNFGNLRPTLKPWQGEIPSGNGYCAFVTPADGGRALFMNLASAYLRHGRKTIEDIIPAWAPAGDGNDCDAYIAAVVRDVGIAKDAHLPLTDFGVMRAMGVAIAHQECGVNISDMFGDSAVDAWCRTGMHDAGIPAL